MRRLRKWREWLDRPHPNSLVFVAGFYFGFMLAWTLWVCLVYHWR